jgi:hypothetical protein
MWMLSYGGKSLTSKFGLPPVRCFDHLMMFILSNDIFIFMVDRKSWRILADDKLLQSFR